MIVALAALVGLALGSFATVLIERVPSGEQWWAGRSRCDACQAPIGARDNVPVVSWLLLRGACRHCGARIGWIYPAIEVVTAAGCAGVAWWWGVRPLTGVLIIMVVATVALTVIDVRHGRLPNAIVLPLYPLVAVGLAADAWVQHEWASAGRAAAGAGVVALMYCVLWLVYSRGIGMGDVKLAPVLAGVAAYFGWAELIVGLLAAPVIGLIWAVVAGGVGKGFGKRRIPFGPSMLAGWWLGLMVGPIVADGYLRIVGLGG